MYSRLANRYLGKWLPKAGGRLRLVFVKDVFGAEFLAAYTYSAWSYQETLRLSFYNRADSSLYP